MARSARGRTRNISLGPLVQHKPPSPRPGRNHTTTSRKQTHNNTKESGLKNPTQNPGLDSLNTTPQNPGLHNVSVTWARQVVALTLSCAAGPDTWSMGTPAHAPPIGLTCASKGPSTHPSSRTCHPTAGRSRGPQHVLQPHIGTVVHRARHSPNHAAHTPPQAHHNPDAPSPRRSRPHPAASCAHTARPGPAAQTSAPAPAS